MLSRRKNPVAPSALTYLGEGTEIEGNLRASGQLRIDGHIRGDVEINGDLEVGPTGYIEGELVTATNIQIHGRIKARVQVTEKLSLRKTGHLEGDIKAKILDMEGGATFIGRSQVGETRALPAIGEA